MSGVFNGSFAPNDQFPDSQTSEHRTPHHMPAASPELLRPDFEHAPLFGGRCCVRIVCFGQGSRLPCQNRGTLKMVVLLSWLADPSEERMS